MQNGYRYLLLVISALVFLAVNAFGLEEEITVGREDEWLSFPQLDGLVLRAGKWDTKDLRLQEGEYEADGFTDLLLHFNRIPYRDAVGLYLVEQDQPLISEKSARFGGGAAAFAAAQNRITLLPQRGSLFDGGWGDFSVEFWLYPVSMGEGEIVLRWTGALARNGRKLPQSLRFRLERRKAVWDFDRFFSPDMDTRISLQSVTDLLPRQWHHHLLRFDSSTGMLEYLLDGLPEAVTYVTDTGTDGGSVLPPLTSLDGKLVIGEQFTGLIDELRIARLPNEAPFLGRYPNKMGTAMSKIFDLGYSNSRLKRIDATYSTPSNTDIYFYYRLSDEMRHFSELDTPWILFTPNQQISMDTSGRFLQIRAELFSDGSGNLSPVLSDMKIVYEPDLPPPPPSLVLAKAGDAAVQLSWRRVNVPDVRGYMVYYGFSPGKYDGVGIVDGKSPMDVSDSTGITLRGLENGRLYYFTVVSYDSSDPPHQSRFSEEVSARPSKIYGELP